MKTEVIREVHAQGTTYVLHIRTQPLKGDWELFCEGRKNLQVEDNGVDPCWNGKHEKEDDENGCHVHYHQQQQEEGIKVVTRDTVV